MLGAIIGDAAGSYYEVLEIQEKIKNRRHRDYEERIKILDKEVPLFDSNSSCTDDSILTCAILDAIVNNGYDKKLTVRIKNKLRWLLAGGGPKESGYHFFYSY